MRTDVAVIVSLFFDCFTLIYSDMELIKNIVESLPQAITNCSFTCDGTDYAYRRNKHGIWLVYRPEFDSWSIAFSVIDCDTVI